MSKKKILFLGQMPPPWHGVSYMNNWILESKNLKEHFSLYPINLATAKSISNIGKSSIYKYLIFIRIVIQTFIKLLIVNPSLCYITITPTGSAFYKDSLILLLMKLFRKPILVHFHGKGLTQWVNSKPGWLKNYYTFIMNKTKLIVLGNSLIDDVRIIYNEQPYVVPNGIPVIDQSTIKIREKSVFTILFLSNLMESKGILDFIESMKLLKEKIQNFKALIIGDSGDLSIEYIQGLVEKHELNSIVEVLGPKYNLEKFSYLLSSDVFVFPTHNEAFGLVILEAMQLGIPIIATNEGSIPEVIENEVNGFIVPKMSPKSIITKILTLINNPDLRETINKHNIERFNSYYTLTNFENNMLSVFNKVTS